MLYCHNAGLAIDIVGLVPGQAQLKEIHDTTFPHGSPDRSYMKVVSFYVGQKLKLNMKI